MAVPPSSPLLDGPEPAGQGSRSSLTVLCATALLIFAVSLVGGNDPSSSGSSRPPQARQAPQAPGAVESADSSGAPRSAVPAARGGQPLGPHLPRSTPVRLRIPRISVDAPFTPLATDAKGRLEAPPAADTNLVGWHAKGPTPGETGTSVIAGHVDTKTSAAVFAGLSALRKGDVFDVLRTDHRTAHFEVDSVETFAKNDFPSRRVYGDTPRAEARLITCAGAYDRSVRDYTDNLVVFAHLR
ncbi:class F sortase [Streptomyces sp. NPDC002588]|uniref:class F sortase n=1 Tax=Streptomyces sp. NPDC002588 TaxID=3154419 RepID=UPI003332648F